MFVKIVIEAELSHISGKFASREEITEAIRDEIDQGQLTEIYGVGADGESQYDVVSWEVWSEK